MLRSIEDILLCFRLCFFRKTIFAWFMTIVVGSMVCSDTLGILPSAAAWPILYHGFPWWIAYSISGLVMPVLFSKLFDGMINKF